VEECRSRKVGLSRVNATDYRVAGERFAMTKDTADNSGTTDCSSSAQLMLPLESARRHEVEPVRRVRLSDADERYRNQCVANECEFTYSFLMETRAQRLGCRVSELEGMLNYERNRHLADEAVIMRLNSWSIDQAAYIDWHAINARAKRQSEELAEDFAAFRRHRREPQPVQSARSSKRRKAV